MMAPFPRRLRTERGRIYVRYVLVSGASVVTGQIVLALLFGVAGWSAETSNLVAFVAGGLVSYTLHRRWTWRKSGRSRLLREVVPFWSIASLGLLVSTWAVGLAEDNAARIAGSRAGQTLIVMAASLAAYGVVWIVKFIVLDRYLFGVKESPATDQSTSMHRQPPRVRR
jgi:putative flippase GtrA